jgi:hypothetical protein
VNDTGLPGVTLDDRDHVCVFHRGVEERDAVLEGFFGAGFAEGDRCLCVADFPGAGPDAAAERLDPAHRRGPEQLTIVPTTAYMTDGRFVPEHVYTQWHSLIGGYEDAGYRHVRGTGDMSWFLRDRRDSGADPRPLLEYEALCNRLVRHRPATIFCFYDLDLLDGDLLPGVLHHHPAALARGVLFRSWTIEERPGGANDALLLANLLLSGGHDAAQIETLLDGLRRAVLDPDVAPGPERDRFLQGLRGLAEPHLRAARAESARLAAALLDGAALDAGDRAAVRARGVDPDGALRTVVVRPPVEQAELAQHGVTLATARGGESAFVVADGPHVDRLVAALGDTGRTVGAGRARSGAAGPARSYAEARRAADFAAALGRPAARHEDLGLFALLADGGDPAALADLVAEWLGPLLAHDRRRRAALLPTLAAFLDSGAAQQATADTLGVHVSTLKYRLARIGEILGRDITAPDIRFQLQVALAAQRTLAVPGLQR